MSCDLVFPALKDRAKLVPPLRVEEMQNEKWKKENGAFLTGGLLTEATAL